MPLSLSKKGTQVHWLHAAANGKTAVDVEKPGGIAGLLYKR
jgi:hypothetical protein